MGHEISGGVCPDAHESAMSEGDLSGKPCQYVQPDCGDNGNEHAVGDVEQIPGALEYKREGDQGYDKQRNPELGYFGLPDGLVALVGCFKYAAFNGHCISPLNLFDLFGAEQTIGLEHQNDDQNHKRYDFLGSPFEDGIEVDPAERLEQPDDKTAQYGAGDAVQTAQDDRRKDLEPEPAQTGIDAIDIPDQDAPDGGNHGGNRPGNGKDLFDADPHGLRGLLIIGHRPHRDAGTGIAEKKVKQNETKHRKEYTVQIDLGNDNCAESQGFRGENSGIDHGFRAPCHVNHALEQTRQADREHDDGNGRFADHGS